MSSSGSSPDPFSSMSKDEISRFSQAMSDPKFRSLLQDYAAEISNPQYKQENELILQQIETEAMKSSSSSTSSTSTSKAKRSAAPSSTSASPVLEGFYSSFQKAMQQQQKPHQQS